MGLMHQQGPQISLDAIHRLLQGCTKNKDFAASIQIYSFIVRSGLDSSASFGDPLIRMFASCGSLTEANQVFLRILKPTLYTWNAIISAHAKLGDGLRALNLYVNMQHEGIQPNKCTFLGILKACASMKSIQQGMLIHEHIVRNKLELDVVIGSSLVDMYAKCARLQEACRIFGKLPDRNVVSWNAMIGGCVQHGNHLQAFELFETMQLEDIKPDEVTFSYLLKACSSLKDLGTGKLIHDQIIGSGLESDVIVGSSLVDMYAKCGSLEKGRQVFDKLADRNCVSWNAMISAYAQQGDSFSVSKLFEQMKQEGVNPEKVTFLCVLKACTSRGDLEHGRLIHEQIIRSRLELDVIIGSTLVDMYAKCGSLQEARTVFVKLPQRDVVAWNAILGGYVQHGDGLPALEIFEKMQQEGIKPEKVTFSLMLKACSSLGAIRQGKLIHNEVIMSGLESDKVVGSTLVDMYTNFGNLTEACKVFDRLWFRDVVTWNAMIAGYALYGNYRLAVQCLEDMQREGLKPNARTYTSVLLACSHACEVEKGYYHFISMGQDHGIVPSIEHFTCILGLLSHAGRLNEAEELLQIMPIPPDITGWTSLLSACRIYGSMDVGRQCYNQVVQLDRDNAIGYVFMSSMYADAHMWEDAYQLQGLRKGAGAWKKPGKACVEVEDEVHEFVVGDDTHVLTCMIYAKLKSLRTHLKWTGYIPYTDLVLEPMLVDEEGPLRGQ